MIIFLAYFQNTLLWQLCVVVVSDCSIVHAQCTECIGETAGTDCTACADGYSAISGDCIGM